MVRQTLERFPIIDIPVNNAAIVGPIAPLWDDDVSSWMQTVQVNPSVRISVAGHFCR